MEDPMVCACGRVWQEKIHAPDLTRRGRIHCRCGAFLGLDEDGSWDAFLVEPREQFGVIRKLFGRCAVICFRLSQRMGIPIWRWIRPSSKASLLSPNRALHVRFETRVVPLPSK